VTAAATDLHIIGTPFTGTHTIGNWQSDNAYDLGTPIGTPVKAAISGRVTRVGPLSGQSQDPSNRFAGDRIEIDGTGQSVWYGHLSKTAVHVGDMVTAGQVIGASGSANGVQHLHFAVENGNPQRYLASVLGTGSGGGVLDTAGKVAAAAVNPVGTAAGVVAGAAGDVASSAVNAALGGLWQTVMSTAGKWLLYGVLIFGGAALAVYGIAKAAGTARPPAPVPQGEA
jgi:murein DD-endopeptidase MepM/ murein hydrolase activator NlpD